MKRIICLVLIFIFLASFPVSAKSELVLENLEAPIVEQLKENTDQIVGRSIWDMTIYEGKLYIGWGDYDKNLGTMLDGLSLLCYTNETNTWNKVATIHDEEIARFYEYKGKLYIPGTDPISRMGSVYEGDKFGLWSTIPTFSGGIHVFDILFKDDIMYACYGQANGAKAVVRYSSDFCHYTDIDLMYDGKPVPVERGFARCYNLFEFDDNVYATLKVYGSSSNCDGLYKLDKDKMVMNYVGEAPSNLILNSFRTEFKGNLVYGRSVVEFTKTPEDINSWKTLPDYEGTVTCLKEFDGALYFTAYTEKDGKYVSKLYKTKDLKTTEVVYTLEYDSYVRSFTYDNGVFYIGTGCKSTAKSESAGTVFSLCEKQYDKTNISVTANIKSDEKNAMPKWVNYQIKAGNKVVYEGTLTAKNDWNFSLENVDARDDWKVVVTEDSVGYKWKAKLNNGVFELTNNTSDYTVLYIVFGILGAVLIFGGIILMIFKAKKKK